MQASIIDNDAVYEPSIALLPSDCLVSLRHVNRAVFHLRVGTSERLEVHFVSFEAEYPADEP